MNVIGYYKLYHKIINNIRYKQMKNFKNDNYISKIQFDISKVNQLLLYVIC